MAEKVTTIDDYLAGINPAFRPELERIRTLVSELVPEVEETISYRMPTLKYRNRALVYFTASKKHMSLYSSSWAIVEFRSNWSVTKPPNTQSGSPWTSPSQQS